MRNESSESVLHLSDRCSLLILCTPVAIRILNGFGHSCLSHAVLYHIFRNFCLLKNLNSLVINIFQICKM